jgi:predicted DNA-binding ArsR family transcriptional regulator
MFNKSNKKETMKHKSIIPKNEYQSYKNDFNKEILNETNQPKETIINQQLKNKVILSMKKDNDLKKYVNDIKKLNDDQFTVLINIFKKVNLNQ